MKSLIVVTCLLIASAAWAVADPDPNQIGVYFDEGADVNYLDLAAMQPLYVYVILTNPTESVVAFAEYRLEMVVHGDDEHAVMRMNVSDPCGDGCIWGGSCGDQCIGIWNDPYGMDYHQGFFYWNRSLPAQPATILLRTVLFVVVETGIEFYIRPVEEEMFSTLGVPTYAGADLVPIPLGVSSGNMDLPVAAVNTGAAPVATERSTWGAVKALYR